MAKKIELSQSLAAQVQAAQAKRKTKAVIITSPVDAPAPKAPIKKVTKAAVKAVAKTLKAPIVEPVPTKNPKVKAAAKIVKLPFCYLDNERHTYIVVQRQDGIAGLLTMRNEIGIAIEYHRLDSEFFQKLTPCDRQDSIRDAVRTHVKSMLPKTELAQKVLNAIVFSSNPDQTDFLSEIVVKAATKTAPVTKTVKGKVVKSLDGMVTLAEITTALKLDPKHVRVQLRAHMTKPAAGWVWPILERDTITKTVKSWFK